MPQRRLAETLQQLHEELSSSPSLDAETTALLRTVLDDIGALLRDDQEAGESTESLLHRLGDATRHFETSHPNLTQAVGQVADALSGMGI